MTKEKRPAWDLKMFEMTNGRIEDLEAEKKNLLTDVEVSTLHFKLFDFFRI